MRSRSARSSRVDLASDWMTCMSGCASRRSAGQAPAVGAKVGGAAPREHGRNLRGVEGKNKTEVTHGGAVANRAGVDSMHVYLREDPVDLEMREVEPEGLAAPESGLIPIAFYADGNPNPSFRAFLPPETLGILQQVIRGPVRLGLVAEAQEKEGEEIQAMVGLTIPVDRLPKGMISQEELDEDKEAWQGEGNSDAWRGEDWTPDDDDDQPRTILLAFAPLVRLQRRHP